MILSSFNYTPDSLPYIIFSAGVGSTSSSVEKIMLFFKRCFIFQVKFTWESTASVCVCVNLLCRNGVHFTFDGKTYAQTNGVAMGSLLGSVLSGIFMVELKNNLMNTLSEHLACRKLYVDGTICFIKNDSIDYVISVLNSSHLSVQFTYETENNNSTSFLDIGLLRVSENIETRVFRKATNADLPTHWQSFTSLQWKHSTLKSLVYRSYIVCSNEKHLHSELKYLRKVFHQNNGYPHWFINRVFDKVQNDFTRQQTVDPLPDTAVFNNVRKQTLLLPYAAQNGRTLVKSLKTHLKKTLPSNVKADIVYTSSPLDGTHLDAVRGLI